MALGDYMLCEVCDRKVFYDALVDYSSTNVLANPDDRPTAGPIVLCWDCNETHEIVVQTREDR